MTNIKYKMILEKIQLDGFWIARAIKSIFMIYTFGLMVCLVGTAQYLKETLRTGIVLI